LHTNEFQSTEYIARENYVIIFVACALKCTYLYLSQDKIKLKMCEFTLFSLTYPQDLQIL